MLIRIFGNLLDDLFVAVRRCDFAFNVSGVELPFILDLIQSSNASLGIDLFDLLTLLQEHAVDSNIRFYRNRLIINQPTILDRLLDSISKHRFTKQRDSVSCWSCSQPNLDCVEMLNCVPPNAGLLSGVATVT